MTRDPHKPARRSTRVALALSAIVPVAGPLYAGSAPLAVASFVAHAVGVAFYVAAAHDWYRQDLHRDLAIFLIVCARLLDVIGAPQAVSHRNARIEGLGRAPKEVPDAAGS